MKQPETVRPLSRTWRCRRFLATACGMALFIASSDFVGAQDTQPPAESNPAPPETTEADTGSPPLGPIGEMAGKIQYVGPDTYILLDSEGRPQPVPGMTYEDFLAAWKQSRQLDSETEPRYSIERLDVEGTVREGYARLQFHARVKLLTARPVDVPLGLLGTILSGEPKFGADRDAGTDSAGGEEYVSLNPKRGGLVAHFAGQAGTHREVTLDLIVPLLRDGTETTLPLNCPRALSSNMSIVIEPAVTNAIVNTGTLLPLEQVAGGGTRLRIAGATGAMRLTWQSGDTTAGEAASVLGAAGAIRVTIDGRSVRSDARLTVQSYGGSFDRFRVRLPPGAQLVRDDQDQTELENPAYRITVESSETADHTPGGEPPGGEIVLVQLPEKQQSPVVIELSTEQPIGIEEGGPLVELGGFEVIGAVRQFGDVALEVSEDWQSRWVLGDHVRQVDPNELDASLEHAGLTAAFQYDRQPWVLGVRVSPRRSRVHVTPQYELEVLADEAKLNARLTYQVFGTRAFEFQVDLNGWEIAEDPIDSGGIVDQDRVQVTPEGILVLPLTQSSSRRAEIAFTVRYPIPSELERVELPLPLPRADSVGTGDLAVTGAADVELLPNLSESMGLTPTPAIEGLSGGKIAEGTVHRFRASMPGAVLVADRLNRKREVSIESKTEVAFQPAKAELDQRFDYTVRYEPIKELSFQIPVDLWFDLELTRIVLLPTTGGEATPRDEQGTPLSFAGSEPDRGFSGSTIRELRAVLPQPRVGQFSVRILYEIPAPARNWDSGNWPLPLFRPIDGRLTQQRAAIQGSQSQAISLDTSTTSTWKAVAADDGTYEFVAENPEPLLPLVVRSNDPNRPASTIVQRVWLQTWLAGGLRQDRAAFRFRSSSSQTTIELPPQVPPNEVEVLFDGEPADLQSRGAGRIVVQHPATGAERDEGERPEAMLHTLELRYRQPINQGLVRRHRITPPQIVGTTALSEVYWQVVLPGDQHVVRSPARLTHASQWQWLGSFWGRQPALPQGDLEEWSGATAQLAPAAADSVYLYTGIAPVSTIELVTAPRWLIVLLASSLVLSALLAWTYVPRAQRGWFAVGAALVIAGLAIAFPTPAMLLAQAAAVGAVIAVMTVLIARMSARPTRWPVTLSTGSSLRQPMPRADSRLVSPAATTASTAPTASLGIPDPDR